MRLGDTLPLFALLCFYSHHFPSLRQTEQPSKLVDLDPERVYIANKSMHLKAIISLHACCFVSAYLS